MNLSSRLRPERPSFLARHLLGAAFLAYFCFTAALYFLGPWDYPMPRGPRDLLVFLIALHVAFGGGYLLGVRGRPWGSRLTVPPETLALVAVVLELALLFPTSAYATGQWFPNPWAAGEDLAAAYTASLLRRETGTPYVNYARMMLSPILALGVPLGVFYWHRLGPWTRGLFACSVAGTITLFIAMGANAGAAHWMALFPWFVLAGHLSGVQPLKKKGWAIAVGVQVLSAALFAVVFSATMVQRTGSFAKYGYMPGIGADLDEPEGAPGVGSSGARIGATGLAGYLTHGYFAVYLGLQEPFEPCYGVGNSVFLQRQVQRLTGNRYFVECSYPARLKARGWQPSVYWSTIYPWIASDVTFPGTVVVVFFVGWFSGRIWLDVLGGNNVVAVALLGQVLILLYYIPAHNKIMHSGEGVWAFLTLVAAWLLTRRAPGA